MTRQFLPSWFKLAQTSRMITVYSDLRAPRTPNARENPTIEHVFHISSGQLVLEAWEGGTHGSWVNLAKSFSSVEDAPQFFLDSASSSFFSVSVFLVMVSSASFLQQQGAAKSAPTADSRAVTTKN